MYNLFKRLLDLIVSMVALILLLPIFLPIIILLRVTAEGEVFYFQERIGLNNSRFQIWKFATMLKNSMNMGTGSITLQNDFRVTFIGKFLRKTKINELPQIINILKGEISLVGPRPLVTKTFKAYSEDIIHSIIMRKKRIKLIRSGRATCKVNLSSGIDTKSILKEFYSVLRIGLHIVENKRNYLFYVSLFYHESYCFY